jgi:hypothetical protein
VFALREVKIASMDRPLTQINYCFYVDDADRLYLCVGDFLRENQLVDTSELRRVVAEDMKRLLPGILILEEQN